MKNRFRYTGLLILLLFTVRVAAQVPALDSVCPGTESHYRVVGEAGSTYTWILTEPDGDTLHLGSTADSCWIFWDNNPGSYILQVIQHSVNGCDADAVYGGIVVFEPPAVYAGADQTIPHGTNTTIGDASITGLPPVAFQWIPDDLLIDPTELTPTTVNLTVTTTFKLVAKDAKGCEAYDEMTIYVEGGPLAVEPAVEPEEICLGGSAQLFANAGGGSGVYSYSWSSVPTGFTSTDPNPSVSPAVTTTYSVTVYDGYNTVSGDVVLWVNDPPTVFAGADQLIMSGSNTSISDATASGAEPLSYGWEPAALLLDPTVLHPVTVNLSSNTTFTLTVTDGNGCQKSDTMTVYIQTDPLTANPTADPEVICQFGYSQLSANPGGGFGIYTFEWTSHPAGFSSNAENPVVSPMETTTYILTVFDGFQSVTDSVTVTVNVAPAVYAGADQTIANGTFTVIADATATGTPPLSYSWQPAALLLDPTVLNPTTVSMAITTTFTLTVTDGNGCQAEDDMTIQVSGGPLEVDPVAEPDAICLGSTSQLSSNATGGTGAYIYLWSSVPAGFWSDKPDPVVSPDETTIYIVVVDDGFNAVTDSLTLTVYALPEVYAGGDRTIPYGTSTTISDAMASGTGPFAYSWTPASLLVDATVLYPSTVNMNISTVFTLTVTDANGCEESDEVAIVVEGSALSADPMAMPQEVCQGGEVQLFGNVTGGSGIYTYNWVSDPPGFTSTSENPADFPLETTTYTITADDGFNTVSEEITVIVLPLPQVTCPPDTSVCEDSPAFALPAGSPAGGTFSGDGVFVNNGIYYFLPLIGAGDHEITYTVTDANGCSNSCPFIVSITEKPQVSTVQITSSTDFQQDGALNIIASGIAPPIYYSIDGGLSWQENNGLFTSLWAGTYPCMVKDGNNCDTSFTVIVSNVILNELEAITGPGDQCYGNSVVIPVKVDNFNSVARFQLRLKYNTAYLNCDGITGIHPVLSQNFTSLMNQSTGDILLKWEDNIPVTFIGETAIAELVFTARQPGTGQLQWYTDVSMSYFYSLDGTSIPATYSTSDVIIYNPPVIELAEEVYACAGDSFTLEAEAAGSHPPLSYTWTLPSGDTLTSNPVFDSITPADQGDYTLRVTDAMECSDQKSIRLIVSEDPVAAFHGIDTLDVLPGYSLDAGAGMSSYLWSTGDTTQSIEVRQEGWFSVELVNAGGCYGMDSVFIRFQPICIDLPNAFTPNSDGLNDFFQAVTICPVTYFRMIIYNRWGEKLFESQDISQGWDGTTNGIACPGDTYVYVVSYIVGEIEGNQVKGEKSGMVLLMK